MSILLAGQAKTTVKPALTDKLLARVCAHLPTPSRKRYYLTLTAKEEKMRPLSHVKQEIAAYSFVKKM
jgi:hypothetical protein